MSLRVLSYNIRSGGAGREVPLLSVIRACDPDIVVFQDATRPAVLERLAAAASMVQCASRPHDSLAFMARRRVRHFAWHRPRIAKHAFLEIVPAGTSASLIGVHLSDTQAAWTERRRTMELRAVLDRLRTGGIDLPVLVGDFHTLAPGERIETRLPRGARRVIAWARGGRIHRRAIQMVLDAGYADAYRACHEVDPGFTFPTSAPHSRYDYLFVPSRHVGRVRACEVVTGADVTAASDHMPIVADLDL